MNEIQIQSEKYKFPYHWLKNPYSLNPRNRFWDIARIKIFISLLSPLKNKKVLDVGCGDGRTAFELIKQGAEVYGIDISKKAINYAKTFVPEGKFSVQDITKTNFKNEEFDAIILSEVIEHIPPTDLKLCLIECYGILKREGILVLSTPSIKIPLTREHFKHYSKAELEEILGKYFQIKKIFGFRRKSKILNLLERILINDYVQLNFMAGFFNGICWADCGMGTFALCKKDGI